MRIGKRISDRRPCSRARILDAAPGVWTARLIPAGNRGRCWRFRVFVTYQGATGTTVCACGRLLHRFICQPLFLARTLRREALSVVDGDKGSCHVVDCEVGHPARKIVCGNCLGTAGHLDVGQLVCDSRRHGICGFRLLDNDCSWLTPWFLAEDAAAPAIRSVFPRPLALFCATA